MAITTVSSHVVSVNAIQGTLIADNAITAVHIATNAVSGTLIADNAVTAVHVAQNSITVTQLADDCVESDKIADGVITTNHLNKAMISSQTEVTPVAGDFVLLGDTSDSNNLKKAPLTLLLNSNVDLSTKAPLANPTLTGSLTVEPTAATGLSYAADGTNSFINFEANSVAASVQLYAGQSSGGYFSIGTKDSGGTLAARMRITPTGNVGIGTTTPSQLLTVEGSSFPILQISNTDANNPANAVALDLVEKQTGYAAATATFGQTGVYGYRLKLDGSSNDLILQSGSQTTVTDRITIERDTGNVGIGTSSPANNLHVMGSMTLEGSSGTDNAWTFYKNSDRTYLVGIRGSSNDALSFYDLTTDAERMRIDSSGKVGIGTTTPGSNSSKANNLVVGSGSAGGMAVFNGTNEGWYAFSRANANNTDAYDGGMSYTDRVLKFHTNAGSERMRIEADGDVAFAANATGGALIKGVSGNQADRDNGGYPQFTFVGNEGTGMRRVSSNVLALDSSGAERMRINASGCIGLGSTADRSLGTNITTTVTSGSAGSGFWMSTGNSSATSTKLTSYQNGSVGEFKINQGSGVNGGTIRLSINDSNKMNVLSNGVVLIGTDTQSGISNGTTNFGFSFGGGGQMVSGTSNDTNIILNRSGGSGNMITFRNNGSTIGNISQNGSVMTYGGTSDYRLKENVADMTNATTRLKQLKPKKFNYISDTTNTLYDGFLAHEVATVVPDAVVGSKDAVDSDGDPEYQMMDNSKLVPLLVKTIQELEARIATLEG